MFSHSKLFKQNLVSVCSARITGAVTFPGELYWSMNFKKVRKDEDVTISHFVFSFSLANLLGERFHWLRTSMTTQPITRQQFSPVQKSKWASECGRKSINFEHGFWFHKSQYNSNGCWSTWISTLTRTLLTFVVDFRQLDQVHCSFHCVTSNVRCSSLCFVWGVSNPLGVLKKSAVQKQHFLFEGT